MDGWADERTWRHAHECQICGRTTSCANPSCPELDICDQCRMSLEPEDNPR